MQRLAIVLAVIAPCAPSLGCRRPDPGPDLQIVDEATIIRRDEPVPAVSPWFDGARVRIVAAKGETIGLQILHRAPGPVSMSVTGATVAGFDAAPAQVVRPSTALYGGSRGAGAYPDGLVRAARDAPSSDPAYFELVASASGTGTLIAGGRTVPVELTVVDVELPPLPRTVWAYEDPRELVWAGNVAGEGAAPSSAERQCIELFARHGVLLSPDLSPEGWAARRAQFEGVRDVPVIIPEDPALAGAAVTAWLAAIPKESGHALFAIPIDEPRTPEARAKVRALADAVRAANDGRFHLAVTDAPDPAYGDRIDLYVSWRAAHREGDRYARWTYNGAPPYAGSMVVDAAAPGLRTWGWIAWRWQIPIWYAWDALYWHDRHNRKGAPLPGPVIRESDAISFDDGEDHGNRDGVLALPTPGGCAPTLRLAALRRGLQDRQLLERAATCKPKETADLAARLVPRALGDAGTAASWPSDPAAWEAARREVLALAASCPR